MKINALGLALVVTAVIGAGGAYWFGMQSGMRMNAAPAAGGAATAGADDTAGSADKRVLYWHDPMFPQQKFDRPGKSPFMDMQLVPVYAGAAGDEGKVTISPRMQQNMGVRTAAVTRGTLAPAVEAVGSVAYNERDVAVVQARTTSYIEKLHVRAPLDPVRKGQTLAEVYAPDWIAAQEEYLSVKRMTGAGIDTLLDAARQRMQLAGMSDEQIRRVEESGKPQARLTVTAPIGGVIAELGAREGMTVATGMLLFRINGLATVWVNAEVPENLAGHVKPGAAVEARTAALPETLLKGRVNAILPEVDATTRTLKVRIEFANPGGRLVPGMFATINFTPGARQDALLVPTEAVIHTGKRSVVIVALADDKFETVEVETGVEMGGQTEIRKGITAGQRIVVSGQFLIDSEASLKSTTTRMGGADKTDSGNAAGATHHGEGRVEAISKSKIMLSHGPIPSMQWGEMTMGFKPPAAGLPKSIKVGDTVQFGFTSGRDGQFEITTITPAAAARKLPDHAKQDGIKQ